MKKRHPYIGLPNRQFWKKEPGIASYSKFDPVSDVPFQISRTDKVVTAGSCFAQHVARYITESGFNHYIAEPAHPIVPAPIAEKYNYGMFSARYGNVYTARQLKQLLYRAYGEFTPIEDAWVSAKSGRAVDPFRPQIHPGGFASKAELAADRRQHLAAVRTAIENMDIFVFTLGLTEAWIDKRDGTVFPLAPGVAGGVFDPDLVKFHNFDEVETSNDLSDSIKFIRSKNPKAKIIITVSPVPLNATMEDRHVFTSTTWSKAVLRIAAERVTKTFDKCCYFPSYEIITSPYVRGVYFAEDCREVLPAGVDHVMSLFFHHFTGSAVAIHNTEKQHAAPDENIEEMTRRLQVLCDEEAIDSV